MKISIIVPIFNVEKYLERCILSIINQTYQNIEIILVNDGSTDQCIKICEKYLKKDKRIILINKENGGLSDARNAGLAKATGDYVLFVDSDDLIELDSCEKFIEKIERYGEIDIITSNAKVINENNQNYLRHSHFAQEVKKTGLEYLEHEIKNKTMSMAAVLNLYKLSFLKKSNLSFKKGILHEDEEFTPRVFLKASTVIHMNYDFYNYILRDNSISQTKNLTKNATDLYNTLYELEKIYDNDVPKNSNGILKDSLCDKYLFMAQSMHETNIEYNIDFDEDFLIRTAFSKKNKIKSRIFSFNKSLYFFINDLKKVCLNDIKNMVNSKNIFYTILLVLNLIFMPRFFYIYRPENTIFSSIFIWVSRVLFILDIGLYILYLRKDKINKFILFIIGYSVLVCIINVIDHGVLRSVISSSYPIVGLIIALFMTFKHNIRHTITVMYNTFLILFILNLVQMIFFTNWIGENVYLLGYRNQLGVMLLIGLFISHLYSSYTNIFYFYLMLFITIFTTLLGGSINNLISICIVVLYLFLKKINKAKFIDRCNIFQFVLTYCVLFISIVNIHIQNVFSFIIEDVFHRSLSLSGRVFLWNAAIEKIKTNLLLGYGRGDNTNYFTADYFNRGGTQIYLSAHNTFLQNCYEFGILPIICIFVFLIYFGNEIKRYMLEETKLFFVVLFSMLVIFMMEALPMDGLFFLVSIAYFYCINYKEEI